MIYADIQKIQENISRRDSLYKSAIKGLRKIFLNNIDISLNEKGVDITLHFFLSHWFIPQYLAWEASAFKKPKNNDLILRKIFPCQNNYQHQHILQKNPNLVPFTKHNHFKHIGHPFRYRRGEIRNELSLNRTNLREQIKTNNLTAKNSGLGVGLIETEEWKEIWRNANSHFVPLLSAPKLGPTRLDADIRRKIANNATTTNDGDGFWESLALTIPTENIENLAVNIAHAEEIINVLQPAFLQSSLLISPISRALAAMCKRLDIPFIHNQHGGGYGNPWHFQTGIEPALSNYYIAWDWERPEIGVRRGPAGRLRQLKRKYMGAKRNHMDILIIGSHRSNALPHGLETIGADTRTINQTVEYCWRLPKNDQQRLVYRYRRQHGHDSKYEQEIKSQLPSCVKFDYQEKPIHEAYALADCVIIERPFTTSELECKYLGIPYQVLSNPHPALKYVRSYLQDPM